MHFEPQCSRGDGRIDPMLLLSRRFIAVTMNFAMMSAAERDCELVTDLAPDSPTLGKTQVMGVARVMSADQTSLPG